MFDRYYKPSNRFSWAGVIILFLLILVVGSGAAWLYLLINRKCTIVILNVLAAIVYGVGIGLLGGLAVKKCKLRSPMVVIITVLLAVFGMTYIKWAMYDYYDYQMIAEQYDEYASGSSMEKELKSEKAYTWFEMDYDFDETNYTFDENWDWCQQNAYETFYGQYLAAGYSSDDFNEQYSKEQQDEMKDCTVYEYYDYDTLLGDSKEECKKNLEKAKEMTAYEYLQYRDLEDYYIGGYETPSFMKVLTHPGTLWADIKDIAEVGRWSYTSSSSSNYSSSSNSDGDVVKGAMLWIVWIAELLIIDGCAIFFACQPAKNIFIEQDNDWAEVYDNNTFTFASTGSAQLKNMMEATADNILNLQPVNVSQIAGRPYAKLTVSHSRDYTENYLNGYIMTYNQKNRNYVSTKSFEGLKVSPMQVGVLFDLFGKQAPGRIASDPDFMKFKDYQNADLARREEAAGQPAAPSAVSAVQVCGSCGVQVPAGKKFCPNCGAKLESDDDGFDRNSFEAWRNARGNNSGSSSEMDSISTDDIDTTKFN